MKDPNVSQLQILMSLTTPVLGKTRQVNFRKKIRGLVYYYNSWSGLGDKHSLSFVKTQEWPNLLVKEAQVEDVGDLRGKWRWVWRRWYVIIISASSPNLKPRKMVLNGEEHVYLVAKGWFHRLQSLRFVIRYDVFKEK